MTRGEGATAADGRAFRATGLIIAAALMTLVTVGLIWWAAVPFGSGVCPAIDPAPLNCSPVQRAGTGLVATICVVALGALTAVLGIRGGCRARPFVIAGVLVLAVTPLIAYTAVAFSSGFPIR